MKTHFSGPVRVGSRQWSDGVLPANAGTVVAAQAVRVAGTDAAAEITIPANSQILEIFVDVYEGFVGYSATFDIGDATDPDAYAAAVDTSSGAREYGSDYAGANLINWADVGPADETVIITNNAVGADGDALVTITYVQAANVIFGP